MALSDTLIDTLFDGLYKILRRLGAGGMANVYLAEDQDLGRRVAIKILNDRHANDDQFVERFRREAQNAAGLSHPNIVSVYDRGEAEGTYYIAMQYLSPEQAKGAPVDQTSDLYSLGIVLYELLTGQVPFQGDTPVEIAMKHLSQTPAPPSTLRPEVPQEVDWIVMRALAKDPADRYQDADEMDADLARAAQGLSVSA